MVPSAAGRLSETPLAHGLVYARNRRLTGRLHLDSGDAHAAILLARGAITTIETRPSTLCPGGFLGTVAYELGFIDTATLDATLLEVARTKRLHGQVLIARNAISDAQLKQALVEQVHRKAQHLFTFPDTTTYAFYDVQTPESGVAVDPLGPTWRGIRNNPPVRFIQETVRRLGHDKLLLAPGTRLHLPPAETELLLELRARSMTLAELKASTQLPAHHVEGLVYLLVIARCVAGVSSHSAMAGPLPSSMPSGPRQRMSLPPKKSMTSTPPQGSLAALQTPADLGIEGVQLRARTVDEESLFHVLGVVEGGSAEAVRAAFLRLSKSWHPDRLAPEFAPVQIEAAKIFARMTRAHQTLCDAEARRGYIREQAEQSKRRPRADVMRDIGHAQTAHDAESVIRHCQELIDADSEDVDAIALQAWAETRWGEASEDELRAALAKLERAVNLDRTNVCAVYHRGLAHKRLNNVPAAFRDFSRALQLDPTNIDAEREVRIFAMRARKGSGEHTLGIRRS